MPPRTADDREKRPLTRAVHSVPRLSFDPFPEAVLDFAFCCAACHFTKEASAACSLVVASSQADFAVAESLARAAACFARIASCF